MGGLGHDTPLFFPKPELCLVPLTVAAGDVVTIDALGVSNDAVLVSGSPSIRDFQAIEWCVDGEGGYAQSYLNSDTTKLSAPMLSCVDGIRKAIASYNIKNTSAVAITLFIRGM